MPHADPLLIETLVESQGPVCLKVCLPRGSDALKGKVIEAFNNRQIVIDPPITPNFMMPGMIFASQKRHAIEQNVLVSLKPADMLTTDVTLKDLFADASTFDQSPDEEEETDENNKCESLSTAWSAAVDRMAMLITRDEGLLGLYAYYVAKSKTGLGLIDVEGTDDDLTESWEGLITRSINGYHAYEIEQMAHEDITNQALFKHYIPNLLSELGLGGIPKKSYVHKGNVLSIHIPLLSMKIDFVNEPGQDPVEPFVTPKDFVINGISYQESAADTDQSLPAFIKEHIMSAFEAQGYGQSLGYDKFNAYEGRIASIMRFEDLDTRSFLKNTCPEFKPD